MAQCKSNIPVSVGSAGGVDGVDEGGWSRESGSELDRMSGVRVERSTGGYKICIISATQLVQKQNECKF